MKDNKKNEIIILVLLVLLFLNLISLHDFKKRIDDLEERQLQVNEYLLNKVGG